MNPVYTPVSELSEMILNQETSPLELTEMFLNRLEEFGPLLNSVVNITRERAIKEAKQAEHDIRSGKYHGPLHGIREGPPSDNKHSDYMGCKALSKTDVHIRRHCNQ